MTAKPQDILEELEKWRKENLLSVAGISFYHKCVLMVFSTDYCIFIEDQTADISPTNYAFFEQEVNALDAFIHAKPLLISHLFIPQGVYKAVAGRMGYTETAGV